MIADATSPEGVRILSEIEYQALKRDVHEELIQSLELEDLERNKTAVREEIAALAQGLIRSHYLQMDDSQRRRMLTEIEDEAFGLGPLEPLMRDPTISDILVNGPHEVYIERQGQLERTGVVFADDQHLLRIVQRMVSRVGRRIDEVNAMVDARLEDGSRINAVLPPLVLGGPKLSIRRFGADHLQLERLTDNHTLTADMAKFLAAAVEARLSLLISGGTGAGKTTLLNALSESISADERIVTIEDSAELILQHQHVVRMETRPANTEGQGEYTQRDLVRNSLRMRPDRIVVGEVRGSEALDMLQAMNTGHEGSLTTIHANDTRDALARLEMMVAMAGFDLPIAVVRQYIAAGIGLIVHLTRLKGGQRRVTRVSEVVGCADGTYLLKDIGGFQQTGINSNGQAVGHFYMSGYEPRCLVRLAQAGIELPSTVFQKRQTSLL